MNVVVDNLKERRSYKDVAVVSQLQILKPGSDKISIVLLTLPSSVLLYEFYVKAGSICLKTCYYNHYLMWLALLLLCGHK